jgi:hypothetical protein
MMAVGESRPAVDEAAVYRKSELGAAELAANTHGPLSPRERQLLILLNGSRTIAELSEVFGADTAWSLTIGLEAKGFAERADPVRDPKQVRDTTPPAVGSNVDEASKPEPRWYHDWFALLNLWMLELVVVIAVGVWMIERRPSATVVPFGATPVQVSPTDGNGEAGPGDQIDTTDPERAATGTVRRSPQPPMASGSKSADQKFRVKPSETNPGRPPVPMKH